jgi:hypothetical protein
MNKISRKEIYENEKILRSLIKENIWNSVPTVIESRASIKLLVIPTFNDYYSIQIIWNEKDFIWNRTKWRMGSDQDFISSWKEIALNENQFLPLELTLIMENGKGQISVLEKLLTQIQSLQIQSFPKPNGLELGKDGDDLKLELGSNKNILTLEWNSANTPKDWEQLDVLTKVIFELNSVLV